MIENNEKLRLTSYLQHWINSKIETELKSLIDSIAAWGGGISSGTKKSGANCAKGTSAYFEKSFTPLSASKLSSIQNFPEKSLDFLIYLLVLFFLVVLLF